MTLNDEPPERIFLQLHGYCEPEYPITIDESVTWCWEQIFPQDIEYVRSDVAEKMVRKAREDCARICEAYSKHNKMHRQHSEAAADCADEIRETIKNG